MKKTIQLGLIAALMATSAYAGGVDRSGQGIGILFEEGRLMTIGMSFAKPEVTGTVIGIDSGDGAGDYFTATLGYKADLGDFSYALIYDQPFGANADYPIGNPVVGGLNAELSSHALTLVGQYNFSERISVYGGMRAQSLEAELTNPAESYTITSDSDLGFGYLIGVAYEIPEIALRLDVTYNSAIEHEDIDVTQGLGSLNLNDIPGTMNVKTPQSVNVNFQTGINEKTLIFGGVRWADWSEFSIAPPPFGPVTVDPLVSYEEDTFTYSLGVARKLTENFSMAASVSYEAADDGESTFLAPTNGRTDFSLGGVYTVGSSKIQAGVSYVNLGDADVGGPAPGSFSDNSAIGFGLKLTQSF